MPGPDPGIQLLSWNWITGPGPVMAKVERLYHVST